MNWFFLSTIESWIETIIFHEIHSEKDVRSSLFINDLEMSQLEASNQTFY